MNIPNPFWQAQAGARREPRHLSLRLSERRVLLVVCDLLVLNLALLLSLALRHYPASEVIQPLSAFAWCVLLSALWSGPALWLNVYDLQRAASWMPSLWWTTSAVLITTVAYTLVPFVTPGLPPRRLDLLVLPFLAIAGVGAWRLFYARVLVQPAFQQKALVVGAGWSGQHLAKTLAGMDGKSRNVAPGAGYHILGFIDDDAAKAHRTFEGARVLGTSNDLVALAQSLRPDEIVVAITQSERMSAGLFRAVLECRERGIPVTTMATVYERLTGRVSIKQAGHDFSVVLPLEEPAHLRLYLVLRRVIDIGCALFGCALVALLVPFVWLVNRVTAPGDLFYRQERVGKGGSVFAMAKFRSMVMHAERYSGAVWASEHDPRITPLGRLLRKTRIDELPQFWNILCGDMSLIGPRPERPMFVEKLNEEIPFYRARHAVTPGLTGWAQVMYRYGASVEDALMKLKYDLYYIKHQGPYLDLLIVLKTVRVVLGLMGR